MRFTFLKIITLIAAIGVLVFKLYKLLHFYTDLLPANEYTTLKLIGIHLEFLTDITLAVIAMLIVLKSTNKNAFYLALALVLYIIAVSLTYTFKLPAYAGIAAVSSLAGIISIVSFQNFPVPVTAGKINDAIKWRWLRTYLKVWLKPNVFWLGMPVLFILLSVVEYFMKNDILTTMVTLLTGFAYLYANFRTTAGIEHSRILWLFWGLAMFILMNLIYYSLYLYGGEPEEGVRIIIAIIILLILLVSLVMSLFFADTFNTGVFIRRSVVNAILFLLIVFVYNTLEHYVLHWISHKLHISDVILSSMLSGLLVLVIAPIHHRLTHYLNRRLKGGHK